MELLRAEDTEALMKPADRARDNFPLGLLSCTGTRRMSRDENRPLPPPWSSPAAAGPEGI